MTDPTDRNEQDSLQALVQPFMNALRAKRDGDLDRAEDVLRNILKTEPRLPEPRLELGRICLDTDRLDEAETHTREALAQLEAGGQWTDDLPENVVQGLAWAQLAEILRRIADEDDVIFGDPARFQQLLDGSRAAFQKAAELDPSDEYASYHAFFLGVKPEGDAP